MRSDKQVKKYSSQVENTLAPVPTPEETPAETGFSVHLSNFDGPFDLLLQLISRHKLDITEVSLSLVTDEFISFIRKLEESGEGCSLTRRPSSS
jgi:segregation and condensation protein A